MGLVRGGLGLGSKWEELVFQTFGYSANTECALKSDPAGA